MSEPLTVDEIKERIEIVRKEREKPRDQTDWLKAQICPLCGRLLSEHEIEPF